MAEDDNALTPEQKKIAVAFLEKHKAGDIVCPVCKSQDWLLADHLVQPVTLSKNNSVLLGGIGYPQIMIVSKQCGLTLFFNAVVAGIIQGEERHETELGRGQKDG